MDKAKLSDLIEKHPHKTIPKTLIQGWVKPLPSVGITRGGGDPKSVKKGDVYFHGIFQHPIVVVKVNPDGLCIGMLLTSNVNCNTILEQCDSRFYYSSFITKSLHLFDPSKNKFIGVYDNNAHLTSAYNRIKNNIL